ncbi:hypothetical protein [Burkholderia cenocepacia]|uniref:hypothetical protein n=1 Tax=Burkholderia cenocepacia TaxID=95486 RepID=UPI002ABE8111|nr:hypothetical protein [Burkholderia cenocepacia]
MLTKKERRALLRARDLIANDKEHMICLALVAVAQADPALDRAAYRLRVYISDALGDFTTLGGWQYFHGIHRSEAQRRADRLAWIDWMLAEGKDERPAA